MKDLKDIARIGATAGEKAGKKLKKLHELLKGFGRAAVAFSGGVDSALLAAEAHDLLGGESAAVTIVSPLLPADEREDALRLASGLKLNHFVVEMDELSDPAFAANPADRCYLCKRMRFLRMAEWAREHGIPWLLDGSNADDSRDYRPGMRALAELDIRSPLLEAGLTKDEIRALSRERGLFTWNKPARACLASRIPYGDPITREGLARVEAAERVLNGILPPGAQFRARAHGDLARIETEREGIPLLLDAAAQVHDALRDAGFRYVTLDLKGYRMGSLNEALPAGLNEALSDSLNEALPGSLNEALSDSLNEALPDSLGRRGSDGKDAMKGA